MLPEGGAVPLKARGWSGRIWVDAEKRNCAGVPKVALPPVLELTEAVAAEWLMPGVHGYHVDCNLIKLSDNASKFIK